MKRNDHLTEQRQTFLREYCRHGDHLTAARMAGYSEKTLANQACRLKRELASEIQEETIFNINSVAPKALKTLVDLAENAVNESVRVQACRDLLDRAGFRPVDKHEIVKPKRSVEEMEAELVRLVGQEGANLLLGKVSKKENGADDGMLLS